MARRKPENHYVVNAAWDDEAEVWVAESDDVPGLITEANSRAHLIAKLATLIPELLELNAAPFNRHKEMEVVLRFRRKAADHHEERIRFPKAA